jgi:hypothetical protein
MVEVARSGSRLSPALSQHLAVCQQCAERWEAETELMRGIRQTRATVASLRSSENSRVRMMAGFGERRRGVLWLRGLVWATAALAVFLVLGSWRFGKRAVPAIGAAPVEVAQLLAEDVMAENDFVPVPYAAPLAPGEYVEVVQAELTPAALARMGFVLREAGAVEVTTDLMVGEDGVPRAVRIPESVGVHF